MSMCVGKKYYSTSVGGLLISLSEAASPLTEIPLLSVMHGQCDARPTVTFPACAGTKFLFILLDDRRPEAATVSRVEPAT